MEGLVIDALATYRLTRLVTTDVFPPVARVREAILESDRVPEWAAYLVECPWCLSFWIGLGVAVVRRHPGWRPVATALALSAVTGKLSG